MATAKVEEKPGQVNNPNKMARRAAFDPTVATEKPQDYYDRIKEKFAEERDKRLAFRPEGQQQYTSDFSGALSRYHTDPWAEEPIERAP